jgi:hypothetical protein
MGGTFSQGTPNAATGGLTLTLICEYGAGKERLRSWAAESAAQDDLLSVLANVKSARKRLL